MARNWGHNSQSTDVDKVQHLKLPRANESDKSIDLDEDVVIIPLEFADPREPPSEEEAEALPEERAVEEEEPVAQEDTEVAAPEVSTQSRPAAQSEEAAAPEVEQVSVSEEDEIAERERRFLLRVVQPGLAGLMDGSVSTLAPIFATAFVTKSSFSAFLVGMAAATGAGISMAFSEALSDDGALTGRGHPVMRGAITGGMTFLGGALHTLPFLVPDISLALWIAYLVVGVELITIAAIRHRFFGTSWWLSMVQVVGGGALVFVAAWFFGHG